MKTPEWIADVLHLFFPRLCVACSRELQAGQILCHHCLLELPETGFEDLDANGVEKLFWAQHVHHAAAAYHFTKGSALQTLIHQIKYKGARETAVYLGRMMGYKLRESSRFREVDILVPMPLHPARLRRRGFNQARLIAEGIAEVTSLPLVDDAIRRTISTLTQTNKRRTDRWENVGHAFEVHRAHAIDRKHVLLIDDVITTGATVAACLSAIRHSLPDLCVSVYALAFTQR